MTEFKLTQLSDLVARVKVGFVGSINEYYCEEENGVPLIRTADLSELGLNYSNLKYVTKEFHKKNKKSQIKKGDLIIARHGENGKANVFKENFEAQVLNAVIIEPDIHKFDSNLLKYFFDSPFIKKQILNVVKGSVQGVINTAHIADVLIPINEEIDYKNLTKILTALDDKIELNNKINTELEQMAKTLYAYWFVKFDFPDANGKPYKSSGGAMVYNEELKRKIPKDWKVLSIQNLLVTSKNGDWGEDEQNSDLIQIYCIRGADINALNGQSETLEPPVRYIRKDHTDRLLKPDDLVVEISGGSPTQSTGRIAHIGEKVFSRFETPLVCSNFCKAISLKEKKHSYIVKQYWNKLYESGIFFNFEGKTSGIKNLMFDRLIQDVHLAIPFDKKLIEEFHEISIKNDELIQNNLLQNKKLTELRNFLLPMLMNGQVVVN